MSGHDAEWDEYRGGTRNPSNYISFPQGGPFHASTIKVLPWTACGPHDQGRVVVPSQYVERLFRLAPVQDPKKLDPLKVMTRCLDISNYIGDALDLLIEEGLLEETDEEGNTASKIYEDVNDLQEEANRLITQLQDHAALAVDDKSFEWLEDFGDRQGTDDAHVKWLHEVSLCDVTMRTGNLESYVDLILLLGPRSTEQVRVDHTSLFYAMVGQGEGGQLTAAMRKVYFTEGTPPPPTFTAKRLGTFFAETKWPDALKTEYTTSEEYAYDLPKRAA